MAVPVDGAYRALKAFDLGIPQFCGSMEVVGVWLVYSETAPESLLHAINLSALPDRTADYSATHPTEGSQSIFRHIVRMSENSFLTVDKQADQIYRWRIEHGLIEDREQRLPLDEFPVKLSCMGNILCRISADSYRMETLRLDSGGDSRWKLIFDGTNEYRCPIRDIATRNHLCAIAHESTCSLYKINDEGEGECIYTHSFDRLAGFSEISLLSFIVDNRIVGLLDNGSGFSITDRSGNYTLKYFPRSRETKKLKPNTLTICSSYIAAGSKEGVFLFNPLTAKLAIKITSVIVSGASECGESMSREQQIKNIRNLESVGDILVFRAGNCHIYACNLTSLK